jgi:hypothetical protein
VDLLSTRMVADVVATATGRQSRVDPALPVTGGPAGNSRLTTWTGLVLLPLFVVELVTLLSIRQLISWHIVLGAALVPPALLKTATTGWRILRYYAGQPAYKVAGPPPLLLRLLGPLVVLSTLAVLGSGLALVALGPDGTHSVLATFAGQRIDALTVHQASFLFWGAATGLHVLGRAIPALRMLSGPEREHVVHGGWARAFTVVLTLVMGAVVAAFVLGAAHAWTSGWLDFYQFGTDG